MISQVKFTATQGMPWERLILVKDRVSHRVIRPLDAWATVKTGASTKRDIPVTITAEGGILLYLSEDETRELPVGELQYDVVATVRRRSALAGGGWTSSTVPVASGIISVSDLNLVSTLEQESETMPATVDITFRRGEDFKLQFDWTDTDGVMQTVTDAYMQAKSATATVVDLRWFASKPTEATIIALPAAQRGYLAPFPSSSLELHISDANSVAAGEYTYDLFVQNASGDWSCIAAGKLTVGSAISTRPV